MYSSQFKTKTFNLEFKKSALTKYLKNSGESNIAAAIPQKCLNLKFTLISNIIFKKCVEL